MLIHFKQGLCTFFSVLILDYIWLVYIADDFFKREFGVLLRDKVLLFPAFLFYTLFALSLYYFVIKPNQNNSGKKWCFDAALFGLITYATFDLTAYAVIRNFSINIVYADLFWGMTVSILSTLIVRLTFKKSITK